MNIESLECRIAPASLTFTDIDGDKVVITTSGAGALTAGVNVLFDGTGHQLQTLALTAAAFQGASVSIVATLAGGGNGLVNVGYINATGRDLGTVLVDGDLAGAYFYLPAGDIGAVTIGGSILAGYTVDLIDPPVGVNGDAQIGPVIVGDWFTSNLAAGVQDNGSAERDDFFGEGDDRVILGNSDKIVSKAASIVMKNSAYGTPRVNPGTGIDSFGFLAQQIGSFKIGRASFALAPGAGNDLAGLIVGATGDLRVREVAV